MEPQRPNVYNRFLPFYETDFAGDYPKFLEELKSRLDFSKGLPSSDSASRFAVDLHKYVILYGFHFSRKEHEGFIRTLYGLLLSKYDPITLENIAKILVYLLKKKYLLTKNRTLVLPWKPLFELYHFWEHSDAASRNLIPCQSGFKNSILSVIKYSRSFFSQDATSEMLKKWRPLINPNDCPMTNVMTFFNLFLPTSSDVGPPESTYLLWLEEFFSFWSAYGNSPAWEIEFFQLLSRLAHHNLGRIDWTPWTKDIFTKIMNALNLPVTYGGSGLRFQFGLSDVSAAKSISSIARWITSTLGGGSPTMGYLKRLLCAIESYYYPANTNSASEILHSFISLLCSYFVERIHIERYNQKWESKTPLDKRISDSEIDEFVDMLMPVAQHILFSDFETERRQILNHLATLRPNTLLPMIISRFRQSVETLTEPQRFHACINALTAVTRPLVENYPLEVIQILTSLLPGIDVNDIWKCTDIFILMSDILEMIWVIDFSGSAKAIRDNEDDESMEVDESSCGSLKISKNLSELCLQSSVFEDFAINFVDKCLRLVENSSREETRSENDAMDDSYNDEEIVADAAITDTFQKIMSRCSSSIFDSAFNKLKKYVQNRILEPAVAGGILAGMCRSVVSIKPEVTLKFFIPHLKDRIISLVNDRSGDHRRQDKELQFVLLLFSEIVGFKIMTPNVRGPSYLFPHIKDICSVLDKTLTLQQKDNYEIAANILETVIASFCQIRILKDAPANLSSPIPYSAIYEWGIPGDLSKMKIKWFIPGDKELEMVTHLVHRYLTPCLDNLSKFVKGQQALEKEEVLRNLRQIYKIVQGSSEVTEPFVRKDVKPSTVLPYILPSLNKFYISYEGRPVRDVVFETCHAVMEFLISSSSDDTVSLDAIVSIFDVILFSFGLNEDDLDDQFEERRTLKEHKKNHLVRSKKHLESVLLDRIVIQYRSFVWLKNIIDTQRTPPQILIDLFELATYRYSEVRSFAQDLLNRLLFRPTTERIHGMILDRLIECLKPEASHEKLKGALHIILSQQFHFMYSWESCSKIMPALITSQHSDKNSVIELLKIISFKINRSFSDYSLFHIPTTSPVPKKELYEIMGLESLFPSETKEVVDHHFEQLELQVIDLIQNGSLHWRRYQMAIGILLGFINHKHIPHEKSVRIWLEALIHDDLTIRLTAFQALEAILKVVKVKRARKATVFSNEGLYLRPGVREDNSWMQYRRFQSADELKEYWEKPFSVKNNVGYYFWSDGETQLRLVDESVPEVDTNNIRASISEKFLNEDYVSKFIDLNSIEHKKGEDFFSWDKAFFFSSLFETFNDDFLHVVFKKVSPLVESAEESQQRIAAEVICGVVGGSRFWSYEKARCLWEDNLIPLFDKLLSTTLTNETLNDWEVCFSAITNKVDQNRLTWLYEFLFEKHFVPGAKRTLNESGILCLMNKVLKQNWKAMDLYNRAYETLLGNLDHPYTKIRHDIAKVLATLTTMDADYPGGWNSGNGFPTRLGFINTVLPQLNLNYRNPVINGGANHNADDSSKSNGADMTEDDSMDSSELNRKTRSDHILETVSNWCQYYFQMTSVSIKKDMYELLPFFCQFIGVETDQELSQSCLKALCFLSVCIVPSDVVPHVLDMSSRIVQSDSYKAKLSLLEFVQVFVFTNFLSICTNQDIVLRIETFVVNLMSDNNLQVRSKAAKILCGLLHSKFLGEDSFERLLKQFRNKIRPHMSRDSRRSKFSKKKSTSPDLTTKEKLAEFHSGILGLCSFVEAYPYEVPEFVPDILIELETHLHDPTPVPKTIKKTLQEFKRTHQDNWDEHKLKFTDDQLLIMTELLVSPNYYA